MTTILRFTVQGNPRPKLRPKARLCIGDGIRAQVYDADKKCDAWKQCSSWAARRAIDAAGLTTPVAGPIGLYITVYHPRTQALSRKSSPEGAIWRPVKPDFDNLAKPIADVLSKIRLWGDDGQVCDHRLTDLYVARGALPGIVVEVVMLAGVGPD